VDTATHDRCRKWLTWNGKHWYNKGQLLETLQFIPKTKKADERKKTLASQTSLTALERWSLNQAGRGNRNHTLARFAFTLVELGHNFDSVRSQVMDMNQKLDDPLDDTEIHSTILTTVNKRIATRSTA
jgi:Primase C terminal 1 (PriCT-1).